MIRFLKIGVSCFLIVVKDVIGVLHWGCTLPGAAGGGGYFGDGAKEISPAMGTVRAARPRRAWEKETASFLCLYPGFSSYKDLSKMIVG